MRLVGFQNRSDFGQLRQVAEFEAQSGKRYQIYYAVHRGAGIEQNGYNFFIIGVIQAYLLGEAYHQEVPVDPVLMRNVRCILKQWQQWHGRPPIEISAPEESTQTPSRVGRLGHAAFFSAGVDSLFTDVQLGAKLTHLISLEHRSNTELDIADGFSRLLELTPYVESTGRQHLKVVTNVMTEMPEFMDAYSFLAHGGALASVGHLFAGEVERVEISSTDSYGTLVYWGSHPLIDPLYSSGTLQVSHFGSQFTRVEKTRRISQSKRALGVLSVCSRGRLKHGHVNCSRCQKCLRTMLTLDLVGGDRSKAVTFDWSHYQPLQYARNLPGSHDDVEYAAEIRDAALEAGRDDVAASIERGIRKSQRFQFLASGEMYIRRRWPQIVRYKAALLRFRNNIYGLLHLNKGLQ